MADTFQESIWNMRSITATGALSKTEDIGFKGNESMVDCVSCFEMKWKGRNGRWDGPKI